MCLSLAVSHLGHVRTRRETGASLMLPVLLVLADLDLVWKSRRGSTGGGSSAAEGTAS